MIEHDTIVEEVRRVRDKIAAEHNYDIQAIGRYYQEKQWRVRESRKNKSDRSQQSTAR
ncbi:MAG: hypothetical protein V3T17_00615 [Pseudomonadales bacterium]